MRRFIIPFLVFILLFGGLLTYVLKNFSPFTSEGVVSIKNLSFFLILFWIEICCIAGVFIYLVKVLFSKVESFKLAFRYSLRQGAFVALFLVVLIIFQIVGVVDIVNIILLAVFLAALELYFQSRNRTSAQEKSVKSSN